MVCTRIRAGTAVEWGGHNVSPDSIEHQEPETKAMGSEGQVRACLGTWKKRVGSCGEGAVEGLSCMAQFEMCGY